MTVVSAAGFVYSYIDLATICYLVESSFRRTGLFTLYCHFHVHLQYSLQQMGRLVSDGFDGL